LGGECGAHDIYIEREGGTEREWKCVYDFGGKISWKEATFKT